MEGREQNRSVFFFCRNIGGEYCLYISSSSNPMSIMEGREQNRSVFFFVGISEENIVCTYQVVATQ